jgi:hypothetical protein
MNSLNSIHNFKKKISVVASATIPFWENTNTTISYKSYDGDRTSNTLDYNNTGGSSSTYPYNTNTANTRITTGAHVFDNNDNDNNTIFMQHNYNNNAPSDPELFVYLTESAWTIVILNMKITSESNSMGSPYVSRVSDNIDTPSIIVVKFNETILGQNGELQYNTGSLTPFMEDITENGYFLIYDKDSNVNDNTGEPYKWYILSNYIHVNGPYSLHLLNYFLSDTLFDIRYYSGLNNGAIIQGNVNLRTIQYTSNTVTFTDFNTYTPSEGDSSYENWFRYNLTITRYTNESLPQILKTRLFS